MEIYINDQLIQLASNATLLHAVELSVGDKQKGIAVAVNDTVIPKQEWSEKKLNHNDKILIIKATQGG